MADAGAAAPAPPDPPAAPDPLALLRSRSFVLILVFAAVVGVVVSLASWGFLELINQIQIRSLTLNRNHCLRSRNRRYWKEE